MAEVKKGNTGRTDAGKAAQLEEQIRKEMRYGIYHVYLVKYRLLHAESAPVELETEGN